MNCSRALATEAITRLETGHILVYSICLEVMHADDTGAWWEIHLCCVMYWVPGGKGCITLLSKPLEDEAQTPQLSCGSERTV